MAPIILVRGIAALTSCISIFEINSMESLYSGLENSETTMMQVSTTPSG
ncbi:MAG: hypothetical protein JHC33_03245 [Ignisphaera sp.]|nr:hypothetical protein [Ignisphaera sp.]